MLRQANCHVLPSLLPLSPSHSFLLQFFGGGGVVGKRRQAQGKKLFVESFLQSVNHVLIGNFFQILCIFNLLCTRVSSTAYPRISRCCSWSMYRLLGWYKSVSCDSVWEVCLHKNLIMYATDVSIVKEIKGGLKNQP